VILFRFGSVLFAYSFFPLISAMKTVCKSSKRTASTKKQTGNNNIKTKRGGHRDNPGRHPGIDAEKPKPLLLTANSLRNLRLLLLPAFAKKTLLPNVQSLTKVTTPFKRGFHASEDLQKDSLTVIQTRQTPLEPSLSALPTSFLCRFE
jgi:hypothetical protein